MIYRDEIKVGALVRNPQDPMDFALITKILDLSQAKVEMWWVMSNNREVHLLYGYHFPKSYYVAQQAEE